MEEKKGKGKVVAIVILIILLLAALGAGGYFYYTSDKKIKDQKDEISECKDEIKNLKTDSKEAENSLQEYVIYNNGNSKNTEEEIHLYGVGNFDIVFAYKGDMYYANTLDIQSKMTDDDDEEEEDNSYLPSFSQVFGYLTSDSSEDKDLAKEIKKLNIEEKDVKRVVIDKAMTTDPTEQGYIIFKDGSVKMLVHGKSNSKADKILKDYKIKSIYQTCPKEDEYEEFRGCKKEIYHVTLQDGTEKNIEIK